MPDPDRDELTSALEERLAAWKPAAPALDRGLLMFEAGRSAAIAEGRTRLRRAGALMAGLMLAGGLGLGWLYSKERSRADGLSLALAEERARSSIAPAPAPAAAQAEVRFVAVAPDPSSYLAIMRGTSRPERGPGTRPNDQDAPADGTWTPMRDVGLTEL